MENIKSKDAYILIAVFLVILISPSVLAKDIAYVVKDTQYADNNIINVIQEVNYSYDIVKESQISSTNFFSYRLVLVGNTAFTSANINRLADIITQHNSFIIN